MRTFKPFAKIARLNRETIITEKLDGTNAQIFIAEAQPDDSSFIAKWMDEASQVELVMYAGSRTRWITPEADNYGFARWVSENVEELKKLGLGAHFGEWWGAGIQRKYGLEEKVFSLFNVGRWNKENVPACCQIVPILYQGLFSEQAIKNTLGQLKDCGSVAAPGFMNPEGIVIFHVANQGLFKVTLENDEEPKSKSKEKENE